MSLINLFMALSSSTLITMILGTIFYSTSVGLGLIYIKSYWGSQSLYDVNCKPKQNREKATIVCLLSVVAYNCLLIFLMGNIYHPRTLNDTLYMALFLVAIHLFLELPHIAYEVRSFAALAMHSVFHYAITAIPLLVFKYYFNISK